MNERDEELTDEAWDYACYMAGDIVENGKLNTDFLRAYNKQLIGFVRYDESEVCAKICLQPIEEKQTEEYTGLYMMDGYECADAIRARRV